ncbi:unnamed protein product, partial [Symbiodinium sp. KB8]
PAGTRVTAEDVLRAAALEISAAEIPVMILPWPLAFLINKRDRFLVGLQLIQKFGGLNVLLVPMQMRQLHQDFLDGDEPEKIRWPTSPLPEWVPWLQTLRSNIHEHINPPAAMGSGHRSLSDKAACEVFKWHLQHPITSDLFQHGASYVAHCSDMGVELSLPDFHVSGSVEALLPDWLHRFIPPDIDVDDSNQAVPCAPLDVEDNIDGDFLEDDDVEPGGPAEAVAARAHQRAGPRAAESFLMPCAFTIGGLQHVVNNLCADVHQGMGNWAPFYSDLKAVEALLRVDERRQRFIWTCLQGTPLEGQSHRFQRFKGSLYESRWHEVLGFLKQLTGLLPKLARAWDSQKYIRGVNLDGQARPAQAQAENVQNQRQGLSVFDPAKVQEAVQSPLFHSYAAMALKLEEVPEALASAAEACKTQMLLLLRLKTAYLQKLPWLLAGLAHTNEAIAKEVGSKIIEQWQQDPRPEAHHRITVDCLTCPMFMNALTSWVEGACFSDLPSAFQEQVAAWRFVPVVETTIEEKHARVSLAKKRHHLGPVRVSLANRLPLFERWLKRGHVSAADFLTFFMQARRLRAIPCLLNIEDHPSFDGDVLAGKPSQLHTLLTKVLYRCSLKDMYHSFASVGKEHERAKRGAAKMQAQLVDNGARQALSLERVLRVSMMQHLVKLHNDDEGTVFYSSPQSCLALQSVESALNEPLTKRQRADPDAAAEAEYDVPMDLDIDAVDAAPEQREQQTVTFQIVLKNPSDKKTIRPAVGAGGRLSKGVVLCLHKELSQGALLEDSAVVSGNPTATEDISGQFLLSSFVGNVEELQTGVRKWQSTSLLWSFRAAAWQQGDHAQYHELLDGIVAAGAFENNEQSLGFTTTQQQLPLLRELQGLGLASSAGREDIRWRLTESGVRNLTTCARLQDPVRLFQPRELPKLEDCTQYELILAMQEQGWEWQLWVPPSRRTRRMALAGRTFEEYKPGNPKVWYSNESPSQSYLLVLLQAERLVAAGLPAVAHDRDDKAYKAILRGDFTEELAKRADIPAEVDALEDLEDDGGGVGDVPHLGDDPSEPVALQAENELPDEVAVSDDELIAELEKLLEEQDQENLQDVNAEGNGDEPEHVAVGNPEEDGRPRDGPAAPASVEAAPAAARHVPARGARAVPPVEG